MKNTSALKSVSFLGGVTTLNKKKQTNIKKSDAGTLEKIIHEDKQLENELKNFLLIDRFLTRKIVSFQANKIRESYRWYKYKEGFSASLIEYLLDSFPMPNNAKLLDPFAGSGVALFVSSELGVEATGIELLPIGHEIIRANQIAKSDSKTQIIKRLSYWIKNKPWINSTSIETLSELNITKGAYPQETFLEIQQALSKLKEEAAEVQTIIKFAILCILESISYTRKDGQYLRWDHRSERKQGSKKFNKGTILSFTQAFCNKLQEIIDDVTSNTKDNLFEKESSKGEINLLKGSCLRILPKLRANEFDCVITSPPYCNRYDYTRTYALELALLDVDEAELKTLRQDMLSCTVENKEKDLIEMNPAWKAPIALANNQKLLQSILSYLDNQKAQNLINNNGIPRMVKGYFYEMACIIYELYRITKKGGLICIVNDNVRYAGANISVDLILSDIARKIGFVIEKISVLPSGKGNSSQQMGLHGRNELRKCVYIWRKPND